MEATLTVVIVLVLVLTFIGSLDHERSVQPHQDDGYVDLDSGVGRRLRCTEAETPL